MLGNLEESSKSTIPGIIVDRGRSIKNEDNSYPPTELKWLLLIGMREKCQNKTHNFSVFS